MSHDDAVKYIARSYMPELKDLFMSIKELVYLAVSEGFDCGYDAAAAEEATLKTDDPWISDAAFDDDLSEDDRYFDVASKEDLDDPDRSK